MKIKWKLIIFLAKYFDMFKYEGFNNYTISKIPLGRVKYKDGNYSRWMPIGNALEYSEIFNGQLEHYDFKEPDPLLEPRGWWTWF